MRQHLDGGIIVTLESQPSSHTLMAPIRPHLHPSLSSQHSLPVSESLCLPSSLGLCVFVSVRPLPPQLPATPVHFNGHGQGRYFLYCILSQVNLTFKFSTVFINSWGKWPRRAHQIVHNFRHLYLSWPPPLSCAVKLHQVALIHVWPATDCPQLTEKVQHAEPSQLSETASHSSLPSWLFSPRSLKRHLVC